MESIAGRMHHRHYDRSNPCKLNNIVPTTETRFPSKAKTPGKIDAFDSREHKSYERSFANDYDLHYFRKAKNRKKTNRKTRKNKKPKKNTTKLTKNNHEGKMWTLDY